MYIDEETKKTLDSYKVQIAVSFFIILAIITSITVTKDLYNQTLRGYKTSRTTRSIEKRGKIVIIVYLLSALYFTYLAYKTYNKEKTPSNFSFLIAAELALCATIIRFINVFNKNTEINEIDDLI